MIVKRKRRAKVQTLNHERPIRHYSVGVYFPDRDVLKFEIKAHDYQYRDGNIFFYYIVPGGFKEFSASFTHVAWVIVRDEKPPEEKPVLPKEFGLLA